MPPERKPSTYLEEANQAYIEAIHNIDSICKAYNLDHRFVGGTLTDLLGPNTQAEIDIATRTVLLSDYNSPQMFRSDKTPKDADLISFIPNLDAFRTGKSALKEAEKNAKREGKPFPKVSIESTKSHLCPRNPALQFVSGFELDKDGRLYLTFDYLAQEIDPQTVEPWTIELADDFLRFTTLNPYAHALRYHMRVPSGIKKKDKETRSENGVITGKMVSIMNLATQVREAGIACGIDYGHMYETWTDFIDAMKLDDDPRLRAKRIVTGKYWDTIGTAAAHGRGIFKPLAELGDRFSG